MSNTHTADLDVLHTHLDVHPDDWSARLVLTDLLLDLGDEKGAACQRWMVEHERRPHHDSKGDGCWRWMQQFDADYCLWMSEMPARLYRLMPEHVLGGLAAVEAALLAALVAAGTI